MRSHSRRRRNDLLDQPWVMIAAVVGVIAVAAIALFFFFGSGDSANAGGASSGSSGVAPATTLLSNTGVASITVRETTPISVPATGAYVEVTYLGSFAGTYGADNVTEKVQDSGDKLYSLESANGTISASFQKQDRSTSHYLTVQIWKDGKAVKSAKNGSAYGIVRVQYP
jgi:hypothetical protein